MIVQDKNKVTLYRSLDELAKSNVLVGRKNGLIVGIDELTIDELRTYIEKANTCDYLQQIIKKAIEYLKENACYEEDTKTFCDDLDTDSCVELLNILRGKDNEIINKVNGEDNE